MATLRHCGQSCKCSLIVSYDSKVAITTNPTQSEQCYHCNNQLKSIYKISKWSTLEFFFLSLAVVHVLNQLHPLSPSIGRVSFVTWAAC